MIRTMMLVGWFSILSTAFSSAFATVVSIDLENNVIASSSYVQGEFVFESDGTFNVLDNFPDHIVANGATSLGGLSVRRVDRKAFSLFGAVYSGAATIGGIELPSTSSFETIGFGAGTPGVISVTSVPIEIAPGGVFRLAGFTVPVIGPGAPPAVPLPAAGWLFVFAIGGLALLHRAGPPARART